MSAALAYKTASAAAPATRTTATVHHFNRAASVFRRVAQNRVCELKRLAAFHAHHGVVPAVDIWAYAFAQTRASAESGRVVRIMSNDYNSVVRRWHFKGRGDELAEAVARDLDDIGLADDWPIIERACIAVDRENEARRSSALINGDALAKLLGVTMADRTELQLRSIGAIDMPKAERQAAAAIRKREADRLRQQQKRAGAKPRAIYEATSASATRPWEAEGVSRATWYRKRKEKTAIMADSNSEPISNLKPVTIPELTGPEIPHGAENPNGLESCSPVFATSASRENIRRIYTSGATPQSHRVEARQSGQAIACLTIVQDDQHSPRAPCRAGGETPATSCRASPRRLIPRIHKSNRSWRG